MKSLVNEEKLDTREQNKSTAKQREELAREKQHEHAKPQAQCCAKTSRNVAGCHD